MFDTPAFLWVRGAANFKQRAIDPSLNQADWAMRHFERRKWEISEGQRDVSQGGLRDRRQRQLKNCHLHEKVAMYFLL